MKKNLLIIALSLFIYGCNMNPSKEARIQELETEMLVAKEKIDTLEKRINTLEDMKSELNERILELEKQ